MLGASGDFNVIRATIATRVNASGLIESVASGIPRLDYYTSGGTAGCPALLVEPSGTNLATNSEVWNGNWIPVNATLSGNTSGTTDPYGTNVADTMFETAVSNTHFIFRDFSVTSGTTYTLSFFVKSVASRNVQINGSVDFPSNSVQVNLSTLAITGAGASTCRVQDYGNGWRRISQTYTATGTSGRIIIYSVDGTATTFLGSVTDGLYVFGAQLETGSVATSYIPTTTAAVTRNADVINLSGAVSGCIGQTEGTLYAEVDLRNLGVVGSIVCVQTASFISGTVRIQLQASNQLFVSISDASGTTQYSNTISSHTLSAGINKIALGYSSVASGFVTALNGSIIETATVTASFGTLGANRVYLGAREASGSFSLFFNNRIRAVALYTTRLTNAELQSLTTL